MNFHNKTFSLQGEERYFQRCMDLTAYGMYPQYFALNMKLSQLRGRRALSCLSFKTFKSTEYCSPRRLFYPPILYRSYQFWSSLSILYVKYQGKTNFLFLLFLHENIKVFVLLDAIRIVPTDVK